MKDVNKIILVGRLGADPVQNVTKNGSSVVNFPVATSRRTREETESGEIQFGEETQWHRVVAWGKQGEACVAYLKKGHPVFIEGMLLSRKYDGKDGQQRMCFEVHLENVTFFNFPRGKAEVGESEEVSRSMSGS